MANKSQKDNTSDDNSVIARVHDLTWALVDDLITDEQMAELEGLLLRDTVARDAYIRCIQLHADLTTEFQKPTEPSKKTTPVLGFLGDASLSGLDLPQAKDANS
jgi:hypothetical protein